MLKDSKLNPKTPGVNLYSGTCREEWFEQEAKSLKPPSKETSTPSPLPTSKPITEEIKQLLKER